MDPSMAPGSWCQGPQQGRCPKPECRDFQLRHKGPKPSFIGRGYRRQGPELESRSWAQSRWTRARMPRTRALALESHSQPWLTQSQAWGLKPKHYGPELDLNGPALRCSRSEHKHRSLGPSLYGPRSGIGESSKDISILGPIMSTDILRPTSMDLGLEVPNLASLD